MQAHASPSRSWKKTFLLVWGGQSVSLLGSNLVQFALVWYLTEQTGSATILVIASLMNLLPMMLLGPFAGALVDRWSRRRVMVAADALAAGLSILLGYLFWADVARIWHIYLILLVRAVGGAFQFPAMQASISLMVPERHLSRVAGWNQTVSGLINIAGPPLGAALLALLPMYGVLAVDVGTALIAILPLLFIRLPYPPNQDRKAFVPPRELLRDVQLGLRYVRCWHGMVWVMGIAVLVNLIVNPAYTLTPLLVTRIFKGGAFELGILDAAWGIGVVVSGAVLGIWGGFRKRIWTALAGVTGLGFGVLLMGSAPSGWFWVTLLGMGIAGLMNPLVIGSFFAILQARVAPEIQGRIITLSLSFSSAATFLGMVISAPAADLIGIRLWFLAGGGIILASGIAAFSSRSIQSIEDNAPLYEKVCS